MMTPSSSHSRAAESPHTCPVWIGYLLVSPVRRLFENPDKIVLPLVTPGARVLELGPGLGFFTVPLAKAVRPAGKIMCVDVQQGMLDRLGRRLAKRGLADHVELRLCGHDDVGLENEHERFDLSLAIHVVHETPSPAKTLLALADSLKPGGRLLLVEPAGHISADMWQAEVSALERSGLVQQAHPRVTSRKFFGLWHKPVKQ